MEYHTNAFFYKFLKVFWAFSLILVVIEILNVIPKISVELVGKPTGNKLCSIALYFSYAIFLFANIWTALSNDRYLIKANNQILLLPHGRFSTRVSVAKI